MTQKANWFAGCDTFEELTTAFEKELAYTTGDYSYENGVYEASCKVNLTIKQYINILDHNFDIKRRD